MFKAMQYIVATPIYNRTSRNFGEIGLLGSVSVFSCKEHIFFALLRGRLNQAAISAVIVRNMAFP